jgi:hypothetical protein
MDANISTPSTINKPPPNASFPHTLAMMAAPIYIRATMIMMIVKTAIDKNFPSPVGWAKANHVQKSAQNAQGIDRNRATQRINLTGHSSEKLMIDMITSFIHHRKGSLFGFLAPSAFARKNFCK